MLSFLITLAGYSIVILTGTLLSIRFYFSRLRNQQKAAQSGATKKILAFFHPYCNAAGGGEKVLWCLLMALVQEQAFTSQYEVVIYTGDDVPASQILQKAQDRFNLKLTDHLSQIKFAYVPQRHLLEPTKLLTMLSQILGTFYYSFLCLKTQVPDIFFDTTGFPFSYALVSLFVPKVKIVAYVHYPFISPDMIKKVKSKVSAFNNTGRIADSKKLTALKLVYYKGLLFAYSMLGYFVDLVYANSSWTANHMQEIWGSKLKIHKLYEQQTYSRYPPCSVENYLKRKQFTNQPIIVSFAQFRPEKNHTLQINVMKHLVHGLPSEIGQQVQLMIIGSCRNEEDENLLKDLQALVQKENLQDNVSFKKNPTYDELVGYLTSGMIGIHTMEYEHFGIALVEMMAAGLIVIGHNSAGPKQDIIVDEDHGFLCETKEDYLQAVVRILQMSNEDRNRIVVNSRKRALTFSDEAFIQEAKTSFFRFLSKL